MLGAEDDQTLFSIDWSLKVPPPCQGFNIPAVRRLSTDKGNHHKQAAGSGRSWSGSPSTVLTSDTACAPV